MRQYPRLPEQQDYIIGVAAVDDELNREGGAWVYALKRQIEGRSGAILRNRLQHAALQGGILGPAHYSSFSDDGDLDITRASMHGVFVGFELTELIHGDMVNFKNTSEYIGLQLHNRFGDARHDGKADFLVDISERGLAIAGDEAKEGVEKWAQEYTPNVRLRRFYALGVGATIFAAYNIHQLYIDNAVEVETKDLDWLSLLPPINTGE